MGNAADGIPLVTPAGVGSRGAELDALLAEIGEIIVSGRYRVADGYAERAGALLAEEYRLPDDWRVLTFRSGTDALARSLAGWGIGAGARVGVPDLAYHAVAGVVMMAGAIPVALDVRADDWNLDVEAVARVVDSLDAVIAVDNYGTPCDRAALGAVGRAAGIPVVLDACESLGSAHPEHGLAAAVDAIAVSFSFTKPIHAAGAGGALAVPGEVADRILATDALLSRQVQLPELNAAALVRSWPELRTNVARLRGQYDAYRSVLEPMGLQPQVEHARGTRLHAPFLLPVDTTAEARDELIEQLGAAGIEARAMFPSQSRLLGLGAPPPVAASVDRRVVCLPTGSGVLAANLAERVAGVVGQWRSEQAPESLSA